MPLRTLMLATGAIAGILASSAGSASEKEPGDDLRGRWTAVKAEREGREAAEIVGHLLIVEGKTFRIQEKGKTIHEGTLQLDASASPAAIDFKHSGPSSGGKTWRGIYKVDGTTLTISDNAVDVHKARPTSFDTGPDSGLVRVVFKRAQP